MRRAKASIVRTLKAAYVVAVMVAIAWGLSSLDMRQQTDMLAVFRLPAALGFVVSWCLMVVLLGWLWQLWIRWRHGVTLSVGYWFHAQALAWTGRYLPGKVGLLLGKLGLASDRHLGWRQLGTTVLVEQIAFVAAGAVIAVVLLPASVVHLFGWVPSWVYSHWTVLSMGLAAATAGAFVIGLRVLDGVAGGAAKGDVPLPGIGRRVALLGMYLIPHVLVGIAFHGMVLAAAPGAGSITVAHSVAVLALAHVAGILAVFAPAGIGVREVVLAAGLGPAMDFQDALLLAAILRILTLIADALVAVAMAVGWVARRVRIGRGV